MVNILQYFILLFSTCQYFVMFFNFYCGKIDTEFENGISVPN